jgi:predicted dehydrogenase
MAGSLENPEPRNMDIKQKHTSRREFLKRSAATAAGLTLAGGLPLARSAHAAGGDTIKIALIGCGGRGTAAAVDCLIVPDQIKLIAVADAFADRAQGAVKRLKASEVRDKVDVPPDRVFVGLDAYQKAIECGADAVLLVEPPGFRPAHYKAAVEAGKHIFMEKPCCVDAPGFRSLMETNKLADAKNLKVVVGLNTRHTPAAIETVKRIHDGAIGPVRYLRSYGNNAGVWKRERIQGETEIEYQMRDWYYFVWLSGDFNVEQHVHGLDLANWANGDQHPIEANGMGGRQVRKGNEFGHIYDHHFVEYTYADGTKLFSQCRHIANCWDAGGVHAHGLTGEANCFGQITGATSWKYRGPTIDGHRQEHVDWIGLLRRNERHNEGYYGATSSFTAILGRMATYSGQVVRWDDAVAKGPDEMPERLAWDAKPRILPDKSGSYEQAVAVPGIYKPY